MMEQQPHPNPNLEAEHPPNPDQQPQPQIKSLNHISLYHTYLQRYYTTYESKYEYVHMHTNALFIIRPKLSALTSRPVKIEGLLEPVEVKGKKKKGGVRVKPNTYIAKITMENGQYVRLVACVEGTAIEYNSNVKVEDLSKDESYILIILPSRRFIPEKAGMSRLMYTGNPLPIF